MREAFHITVICVVPSYIGKIAQEYKTLKYYQGGIKGVNVIRVRVSEFLKRSNISRYYLYRRITRIRLCIITTYIGGLLDLIGNLVKCRIYECGLISIRHNMNVPY